MNFLDSIRPKEKTGTSGIVDLVSPAENPIKPMDIEVLKVGNIQNMEERKDDLDEHQEKNKEDQEPETEIQITEERK